MKLLATFLIFVASLSQAVEYVSYAVNTNLMTQGQINGLKVWESEHFPDDMLDGSNNRHQASAGVWMNDGTNNFQYFCRAVPHLEKVRVRKKYHMVDGEWVEDVSKRKTHGRKVTDIRIANIREPFNGSQFKIERNSPNQQAALIKEWNLLPGLKDEE